MAAGNWTMFQATKLGLAQGVFNLGGGGNTIIAALLTSLYSPSPNTQAKWGDVSANEVATGAGYTQGGILLGAQSLTASAGVITFTGNDLVWPTFSATFKYAVLATRAGVSLLPTDNLIGYCDLNLGGGSITGLGGTLTIQVAVPNLFSFT